MKYWTSILWFITNLGLYQISVNPFNGLNFDFNQCTFWVFTFVYIFCFHLCSVQACTHIVNYCVAKVKVFVDINRNIYCSYIFVEKSSIISWLLTFQTVLLHLLISAVWNKYLCVRENIMERHVRLIYVIQTHTIIAYAYSYVFIVLSCVVLKEIITLHTFVMYLFVIRCSLCQREKKNMTIILPLSS